MTSGAEQAGEAASGAKYNPACDPGRFWFRRLWSGADNLHEK